MTAWKQLELRICRALGGERRGPTGRQMSDCTDAVPFAVQVKRTSRMPCAKWLAQAKRDGKLEGRPWLLVLAGHNDSRPIVVMDFWHFAELAQRAGLIPAPLLVEEEG